VIFKLGWHLPMNLIRIIKHQAVPKCGSYEVKFFDGRPSKFFTGKTSPAVVSVQTRQTASRPSRRPRLSRGPKEIASVES
jgi:hypothetical protein